MNSDRGIPEPGKIKGYMAISSLSSARRRGISAPTFVSFQRLACLLVLLGTQPLWATLIVQSSGVVTQLPTGLSTIDTLSGIVTDFSGNVFVADTSSNEIIRIGSDGVTTSVLPISGLSQALVGPRGMAIDSAANLYIADTGNSRVVEVTAAGVGSVISTSSITLNAPQGVAVDVSGNIYISDTGNSRIIKIPSGGTAAVFTITNLSPVLSNQRGVTTDPLGNLYIADTGNNRVVEVSSTGVAGTPLTNGAGTPLNGPSGVAFGRNGLLYVADTSDTSNGGPTPGRIVIVDSQGTSFQLLSGNPVFNAPPAVTVNAMGTVYVVDNGGTSNAGRVQTFQSFTLDTSGSFTSSVGFPHVQLGSAGTSITIPFAVGGNSTLTAIGVYTGGLQNLDFTIANSSTCAANTTSTDCSVDVTFTPTAAGLRKGALALTYTSTGGLPSGTLTVPLYGVADAPVSALTPAAASVVNIGSTTLSSPFQAAVDAAGNTYVANYGNNTVVKIPAGGGTGTSVNTGSFTLSLPTGVAVDASGNLFIADYGHSRIVEVSAAGVASLFALSGLSTSIDQPTDLAFDGAGNLYITDYGRGRMVEVNPYGQATVLASGSVTFAPIAITGSTVDTFGNVYVANRTTSQILRINPLGQTTILSFSTVGALNGPQGVAVDPSGNIYVIDSGNQRILLKTASGATSQVPFKNTTIGSFIFGITPDANGNILVADWTNNRLVKVDVGQSLLSFASTNVGAASSDSPKTATVTNLGDQPLLLSANPTYTTNFPENSADTNLCTASTTLAAGAHCDVSVKFVPQTVGSLSANITVTNNTLNVASSTQQIAVSGIGLGQTTTTTIAITPTSAVYGQPVTIAATVADTANPTTIPTGSVSFVDVVGSTVTQLNSAVTLSSAGVATLTGVVLQGIGTHTIMASYPGAGSSFVASNNSTTIALTRSPVTVSGPSQTVASGHAGSATVTVAGSYLGVSVPSGTVSYTIASSANATVASGTATLTAGSASSTAAITVPATLAPGTYVITVTYSGDGNYQATSAATSITLHIGQLAATTALVSSGNPSVVTTAVTFSSTTTSTTNGTPTGSVSFYDGTALLGAVTLSSTGQAVYTTATLAVGSHSITAAYSGDTSFPAEASAAVVQVVQKATATTVLVSSVNPTILTNPVMFTATTTSTSGTPTGSVSFYNGTTLLATAPLSSGQASYATDSLPVGTNSITAVYSGDSEFASATSAALAQLVQDFTVTTSTPGSGTPTATIAPGGTATYTLSFSPTVGTVFPAPITLSLSGLPPGATGTLTPQELPAGSSLSSVTLTIKLPQTTAALHKSMGWLTPALALLLLPFAGRMRRNARVFERCGLVLLFLLAGAGAMAGLAGCGTSSGFFGQPEQTYVVVITATSGSLSHSTSVKLTVQ